MSFPTASETFACNDIKTIIQKGVDVSVHCLRPKPSNALEWIKERGLENVLISDLTGSSMTVTVEDDFEYSDGCQDEGEDDDDEEGSREKDDDEEEEF